VADVLNLGLKQMQISSLFAGIGGSVGGGILWELAILNPQLIKNIIPVATDWKSPDWVIANCYIQDNILNNSSRPLYDARLHAMTLYRTPESFTNKFSRSLRSDNFYNIESWLNHHGKKLEHRFSLAAYKMMNQLLKTINVADNEEDFKIKVKTVSGAIHIVTINSDLLFKNNQNWNTFNILKTIGLDVSIYEIDSEDGHDAFLIEYEQMNHFLSPIFKK
jgi:homoserine O-acetyltransferase